MAVTEAQLAQIRREIDAETERRLTRVGYQRPEPRAPEQTAAQKKQISDNAWNAWFDSRIKSDVIPAVGEALARTRADIRKDIRQEIGELVTENEALAEQVASVVRDYTAGALAPLRAELDELKGRLAETEAKLAAVTGERAAAPLALPGRWAGTA